MTAVKSKPIALALALALASSLAGCSSCARSPVEKSVVADGAPDQQASLSPELQAKLLSALRAKGPSYVPNTRHKNPDGSPKYTNRLILETSPYLLQHAHNPVNWYSWGDEAFAAARRLGRPVLLSIGYSTCHWCHVMEEESFEDEQIAQYLNANYIAIKVDREERPDIDAIYMSAVQSLTGSGGWPMTAWLTPDKKPFFGGTYFPARDGDRGTRVGFFSLLKKMNSSYHQSPEEAEASAAKLVEAIRRQMAPDTAGGLPSTATLDDAAALYASRFDVANGGMRGAPKFPSSLPVRFLLRNHRRTANPESLRMATVTLQKMADGGIYDQVGGGFHRYSTDERWLVPHFEKMLYDNALLTLAYVEGYQAIHRPELARIAREVLRYVEREMTSGDGAFYSASDADSLDPSGHLEEGRFFTWTEAEIAGVLGADQARIVNGFYGVTEPGNFEGRSILFVPRPLADAARDFHLSEPNVRRSIEAGREKLYLARAKRTPPRRDDKILTAWNGLMISALAKTALALGENSYAERAARAATFVLGSMRKNGRLLRSSKDGEAAHDAYLDDYAFLIAGLLDLYEVTGAVPWLEEAIGLDATLEEHYEDKRGGGFFLTSDDHEKLLARDKPSYDGAEPSGNSVHALNLLRLHELTTKDGYRQRAERLLTAFGAVLARSPSSLAEMLLAVDFFRDAAKEIVIVVRGPHSAAEPYLAKLRDAFLPNRVLVIASEGAELDALARVVPLVKGKVARDGRPTAYVCEKAACELPTTDPEVFATQLRGKMPRGK
jgi:uncharacterized protein YyaL (SSP411 family)